MKLLEFHPNRYFKSRPFAKKLIKSYRKEVGAGLPTLSVMENVLDVFVNAYNAARPKLHIEPNPLDIRIPAKETSYFCAVADYYIHGKNIFHFLPEMTKQFMQSDVDEVAFFDLRFPYNSFYMSFGPQQRLDLWGDGYLVDGAYVSFHENILQIMLSTIRDGLDYYPSPLDFVFHTDKYYYFSLEIKDDSQKISQAINESLEADDPFKCHARPDESGVYNHNGRNVYINDVRNDNDQVETRRNERGFAAFREALKIIVNGLCYISAYRNDVKDTFPDEAPKKLTKKYATANCRLARKRALQCLARLGFSRIRLCGESLQRNKKAPADSQMELQSHWRRGHWRNQAYGKGFGKHRLVWIRPTVVRQDKGEPKNGHIYDMDNGKSI